MQSGSELDQGVKSEMCLTWLFQSTFTCTVTQKELSIAKSSDRFEEPSGGDVSVHTSHRVDLRMWP